MAIPLPEFCGSERQHLPPTAAQRGKSRDSRYFRYPWPSGSIPFFDYAFRMLFGSEKREAMTIRFINAVRSKLSEYGKFFIPDVAAEDVRGRKFNIEVQIALPAGKAARGLPAA
jgi:hypothetical protein